MNTPNLMSTWQITKLTEIDGISIQVKERTDATNRHGPLEYIIDAYFHGELVHSERHPWNVWTGHCSGQLLLPEIAKRAKSAMNRAEGKPMWPFPKNALDNLSP